MEWVGEVWNRAFGGFQFLSVGIPVVRPQSPERGYGRVDDWEIPTVKVTGKAADARRQSPPFVPILETAPTTPICRNDFGARSISVLEWVGEVWNRALGGSGSGWADGTQAIGDEWRGAPIGGGIESLPPVQPGAARAARPDLPAPAAAIIGSLHHRRGSRTRRPRRGRRSRPGWRRRPSCGRPNRPASSRRRSVARPTATTGKPARVASAAGR